MTLKSNEHTIKGNNIWSVWNLHYMIEVAKALRYKQNFILRGLPSPALCCIQVLNHDIVKHLLFWNHVAKFYVGPTVDTGFRVCSNGPAPLTRIDGKTNNNNKQILQNKELVKMMILSLVAMTKLKKNVA